MFTTRRRVSPTARRATAEWVLFSLATSLLAAGGVARLLHASTSADALWIADSTVGLTVAVVVTGTALLRRRANVDLIAVLALAGSLAIGENLAGAIITVMLATGRLLDAAAMARTGRDLRLLVQRAPRRARIRFGDSVREVPVEQVEIGDRLVVGGGETVPVDGRLTSPGVFDEAALTGEPIPVSRPVGDTVRSGVTNAGGAAEMLATSTASESTYAEVVRLVRRAQDDSAPFVRLADSLAAWFVPLTLLVAGAAWTVVGSAERAVAVLVVATPCPLLLAAPIAMLSGLSRAARNGVIIKGGDALEKLAAGRVLLLDKTGTLTAGAPRLTAVVLSPGASGTMSTGDLLDAAASLEQLSPHVLAGGIVSAAVDRGLELRLPSDVTEEPGLGVKGCVDGHTVRVGRAGWALDGAATDWARGVSDRAELDTEMVTFVGIDGAPAGALLLSDPLRPEAPRMVRTLRANGIDRVVLLTGDRADVADRIGRLVGVDDVVAGCDPATKLDVVRRESARASTVMVGDGINDAPALAAAGAGVALAARGSSASSEAADVVLTANRVDTLAAAIRIARRCRRIARQAAGVGMGLAGVAIGAACAGVLSPAVGALAQEGIDVLAILIALRALTPPPVRVPRLTERQRESVAALRAQHVALAPLVDDIVAVADALRGDHPDLTDLDRVLSRLQGELMAHERADQKQLVPLAARALGSEEATSALSYTHAEISRRVERLVRLRGHGDDCDVAELQRALYELHTTLHLHNALEEESVSSLDAP
jgi:heavy metal translocating P-type ATPase